MEYRTNIRPEQVHTAREGAATIILYNPSAVNLWLAKQETMADSFGGIPVVAGAVMNLGIWQGDLWIGADADNTRFRVEKTKPLVIPE